MANYKLFNLLIHFYLSVVNVSSIYIEKNAYKDIIISISENVQKTDFSIETLKDVLTKSSEFIYHATRKRSYFGEFIISLPSSLTAQVCEEDDFIKEIPQNIDVYLTNSDQKRQLSTKHSRGCGLEGDRIDMPLKWLNKNVDKASLARQFVQHWSTYRYGVFEEKTIVKDSCYLSGKAWTPVGCYNIKPESEPTFEEGLPVCSLPSDFFETSDLKSSLMSDVNSSKALDFCDGISFPHNPAMPTLHNTLCKGRTVWSVIENSPDFKYGMNLPLKTNKPPKSPVFKCFKEESIHVILAIQTNTIKLIPYEVMKQMRGILYEFLGNIAPQNSKVTLLTFADKEDSNAPFDINIQNPKELHEQLLLQVKVSKKINNTCLSCGFQNALNVTQYSSFSSPIVVVIAWKSAVIDENPSVLINTIEEYSPRVRLHLILVEDIATKDIPTDIIQAIRSQNGLVYFLPQELVFRASKLLGILAAVVKKSTEVEDRIVVVHEKHYIDISQNFVDSFTIPSGKFHKMLYIMYCSNSDNSLIRSDNSNCASLSELSQTDVTFKCGEVWNFSEKKEKRKWEYPFSYYNPPTPLHCSSIAMLISTPSKDSFTLKGWLSEYVIKVPKNALTIYTEIVGFPQHKFNVTATISGPGLTSPAVLELRDNGNGDPDTKADDGIYSRYFTKFSKKGIYIVTVSAEHLISNADTFFVGEKRNQGNKLVQSKTIGFFYVIDTIPKLDTLPPNRVADLRVVSINHDNRTAVLQWTAPGGDYDEGKAAVYEIKYSWQPSSLSDMYFNEDGNFQLQPINAIKPNMTGDKESVTFRFPQLCNRAVCYVALRAIDENNNIGDISNIIQIYFNQSEGEITIKPTDSTDMTKLTSNDPTSPDIGNITNDRTDETVSPTDVSEITSTSTDNSTILPPTSKDDFFDKKTIIILSSSGGILLLIIIINIIICCCCIKKIKRSSQPKKLSRKDSLRPPYNLNIAYQEDDHNSSSNSDNFIGVSMNSLADPNNYTAPEARTKPSQRRKYSYHTDKSLQNKAQKDSELGFKIVQTQPAHATSSLSRYGARARDPDTESETEFKSAIPQPQAPSGVKDAQVYPLGVV